MVSDVNVIKELIQFEKNFQTPTFSQFFKNRNESSNALEKFFLEKFTNYGLPVLTEPCELLDLVDQIPGDIIPLYQFLVMGIAKIHWNPNRNSRVKNNATNETFQLYDLFKVNADIIGIYENHVLKAYESISQENLIETKPSNLLKLAEDIIILMKNGKGGLDTASKFSWFIPDGWEIPKIQT